MIRNLRSLLAVALLTVIAANSANAGFDYGFYDITHNNSTNEAIGEAQLSVNVSDAGGGLVRFLFSNSGPLASSITDVYFDDRVASLFLRSFSSLEEGSGVDFTSPATPGNLPGAKSTGFKATSQLTANSTAPVQPNGVNPGETLGLVLTLTSGRVFSDVVSALQSTALRIGIHVQGFANGGSESFINNPGGTVTPPPPVVPEPSSIMLVGTALVGLVIGRRRLHRAG